MLYLDNAATTYPKPRQTRRALCRAASAPFGNPGRGGHEAALFASRVIYRAREGLCEACGCSEPERVCLFQNATQALNCCLFGYLQGKQKPSRVLTSTLEHNSVLRPLYELERRGKIELDFFVPAAEEEETVRRFSRALTEQTVLCAVTLRSNVSGQKLPAQRLASLAHEKGALFLADGAQSAGHDQIALEQDGMDCLCVPAHKGLYGVMGLGAALFSRGAPLPEPYWFGGSGFESESRFMPKALPERLEAGTLPVCAAAALVGGLSFLKERGREAIALRIRECADRLAEGALELGYRVYSVPHSPIVLLTGNRSPEELADALSREGIAARAGLHCAPKAHETLGTLKSGALRLSFGAFQSVRQTERCLRVLTGLRH